MVKDTVARTDRRVVRTRRRIEKALFELIEEKGFRKMTVQDIAERADINRATFYAHYEDKYDLLMHSVESNFLRRLQERVEEPTALTDENIRALLHETLTLVNRISGGCMPGGVDDLMPYIVRQLQDSLYAVIQEWIENTAKRHSEPAFDEDTLAMVISSMVFGTATQWIGGPKNVSAEELIDSVMTMMISGVGDAIRVPEPA